MAHRIDNAANIEDLRMLAKRRLPRAFFEFLDRGTEDEVALANNRTALQRIQLNARVLVDVTHRSQHTELFGKRQEMPVIISPTGVAGLLWYDGEVALARAAAAAGIPFSLATTSVAALEDIAERAGGRLWYQVYMWPERKLSYEMIDRARAAGCEALILTVDGAVSPNREYNTRNGYTAPFRFTTRNVADVLMHPRWMLGTLGRYLVDGGMPEFKNYPKEVREKVTSRKIERRTLINNQSLNWEDVKELRRVWKGPLIIKGIMNAADARIAASHGADAVLVSNHGGRNLDAAPAPIEVLPEIVDAIAKSVPVLVDSGFRRGSDVIKALALGASAVLIGRGTLYGTAAAGEPGARRALQIYRTEIDRVMGLMGCCAVSELGPHSVRLSQG
ncbi:alpha-hydroxy acid oxidase [Hydrogenophaga sp. SNF1]|uniref:alpha-hydroxy acid oxidase n=1 Tax=Hydrogenophaga sp. SNF1 TaxID=3098762 RepID=UPI002ACBE7D5|nr:alpha-hydroxy acid oxidase [Hydrogenophaga sp. SNF1]WQB84710.1 alpha-hydroxy acid oxidase [Hydrogenophaga sp. SNF1]